MKPGDGPEVTFVNYMHTCKIDMQNHLFAQMESCGICVEFKVDMQKLHHAASQIQKSTCDIMKAGLKAS